MRHKLRDALLHRVKLVHGIDPSECRSVVLEAVLDVLPDVLGQYVDEELARRAEALPELIGHTEHGDKVYLRRGVFEVPEPDVAPPWGDAKPLRLGKHGDPHVAHHPACRKPDAHEGSCIDLPGALRPVSVGYDTTRPLYAGDGLPNVKTAEEAAGAYLPIDHEPEPEPEVKR